MVDMVVSSSTLPVLLLLIRVLGCQSDVHVEGLYRRHILSADTDDHSNAKLTSESISRIADDPACKEEIARICGPKFGSDAKGTPLVQNFEVLDCLSDKELRASVNRDCQNVIYQYKLNMTRDPRFEAAAEKMCSNFIQGTSCGLARREKQNGQFLSCLMDAALNITVEDENCRSFLVRMESVIFSDYHLIHGFANDCKKDIDMVKCGLLCEPGDKVHLQHNQGCVIECLMENIENVSRNCQGQILKVAEMQADDFTLDRPLFYACQDDRDRFCAQVASGNGAVYSCLFKHKSAENMSPECVKQLTLRQQLMQRDVKVNKGFMAACKKDIQDAKCLDEMRSLKPIGKEAQLSKVLLCLEKKHFDDGNWELTSGCLTEVKAVRRSLMEDYQINPEVVAGCHREIHNRCQGLGRKGKTLHCLMDLARPSKHNFKEVLSPECKTALNDLVEVANPGEDPIAIDALLEADCRSMLQSHCQGTENSGQRAVQCLMMLSRNDDIDLTCKQRLMEMEYFITRDLQLDPELWQACHSDVKMTRCDMGQDYLNTHNGPAPGRLVFTCLHRHMREQFSSDTDGNKSKPAKLSQACMHQVRRVLHDRAASIDLVPELEELCLTELGRYCATGDVEDGEELSCLQEHYDDLGQQCKEVVKEALEDQDEDIELDRILARACKPMLEHFCKDVMKEDDDEGKVIECLVENKNDPDMDEKCRIGIEHHQISTLKDFELSFAFKRACKTSALKYCKERRAKYDVVLCLSEVVRNDTLLDARTHRIPTECRKELRFELLSETENVMKLSPQVASACGNDVDKFCKNITPRQGAVLACLQRNQKKLSRQCYKQVFQLEEVENAVVGGNYDFYRKCKPMLKLYCTDVLSQPLKARQCLSNNRRKPEFDSDCLAALDELEIEQNTDIRLNPLLQKACRLDIEKYCQKEVAKMQEIRETNRTQALVIQCLRKQYLQKGALSSTCHAQMELLVASMNEDYRKDTTLSEKCVKYIEGSNALCSHDDPEMVVECLKNKFTLIKEQECQFEVFRLIAESRVDVRSDPVLYHDCADDVRSICSHVIEGAGRQMACLIYMLDSKPDSLTSKCRTTLITRKKLWEYSVQFPLPDGFRQVIGDMVESPSRWYFLAVALSVFSCVLFVGVFCGRATKRLPATLKNK